MRNSIIKYFYNFKKYFFFYQNSKAIGPVVATALLLVVSVVSVVGFQGWFDSYSNSMFSDVEIKSNSANSNDLKIDSLIGNRLYIINNLQENLSINKLSIGGFECLLNTNLSILGMNNLNVSDCLDNITTSTPDIVLITKDNVLEKKIFIQKINHIETISSNQLNTLNNGLLSYYPLDNISKLNSIMGNVQTLIEEPYGVIQKINHIEFTRGEDSSINTPGNSTPYVAPGFTHNWTISQWFYTDDLANDAYQNLWHDINTNVNSAYGAVIFNCQSDEICITYAGGCISPIVCTQSVFGEGQWHHLVTIYSEYNSTNYNWTVVLDNQKNSVLTTRRSNSRTYLNFGDWGATGDYMLEGGMRDIGIWNRVLTDSEVTNLYNLNDTFSP